MEHPAMEVCMEKRLAREEIVDRLAPCGIDCERCVRYAHGRVRSLATGLAETLKGFENMAPIAAGHVPCLGQYDRFLEVLGFFAEADCAGCRIGGPDVAFCTARNCFREQGVDFCFECAEYPCERNAYPEDLARRWRAFNDRMREVGVEEFYRESLEKPRY
jgi:hypothetical protein